MSRHNEPEGKHGAPMESLSATTGMTSGSQAEPRVSRSTLEGVRRRDPTALSELYESYFPRIFNLVYRLLGDHALAEDALREVFLKVHRAAHQLDPGRDPGPWLTAIAYNSCRERWRSRSRRLERRTVSLDNDPDGGKVVARSDRSPETDLLGAERERLLMAALEELPEDQRVVVILHDYQGLPHEEIARIVGARHDAVRQRHSRALAALRTRLQELWP